MNTDPDLPDSLTFTHVFSRSCACTTVLKRPTNPSDKPAVVFCEFQWRGKPKPKHLGEYRQFCLHTQEIAANTWGIRTLYALGVSPYKTELWGFAPGEAPKLLDFLPGIP